MRECIDSLIYEKCWTDIMRFHLEGGILHDVEFIFKAEPPIVLKAHQLILAMRSPVFNCMFYGTTGAITKASYKDNAMQVLIKDIEPGVFAIILKYMYTSEIDISMAHEEISSLTRERFLIQVLYSAKKYILKNLETQVVSCIHEEISYTNVSYYLQQSIDSYVEIDKEICKKVLLSNAKDFIKSPVFCKLRPNDLLEFVSRDDLECPEIDIMNAIFNWAKHYYALETGEEPSDHMLRTTLGEIFNAIRFPLMNLPDFHKFVMKRKLLTAEEINEIMLTYTYLPNLSKTQFSKQSRQMASDQSHMFATIYASSYRNEYKEDRICLKFQGRLIMKGLCLLKPTTNQTLKIYVKVVHKLDILLGDTYSIDNWGDLKSDYIPIKLPLPLLINARAGDEVQVNIMVNPAYISTHYIHHLDPVTLENGVLIRPQSDITHKFICGVLS